MPRKPKHPCAYPGCPELVESGERYCREHAKEEAKRYERYGRDPQTKKRYGRVWSRIRASYAREHPFCEMCYREGRLMLMDEVHHILPVSKGGTHERNNLMSLCRSCHNKIHIEMGDRHPHG